MASIDCSAELKVETGPACLGTCASLTFALLLLAGAAHAGDANFKCNNSFVSLGDTKYEVLTRCGEPIYREVVSGDAETKVEEWIYDSSSGYKRLLRFHGGRLARIERLSD